MSVLLKPLLWFYHEFGLAAIHKTGRNAYLIILARACRMLAHGAITLVLALFLSSLEFSDYQIGLFFTLVLLGDVFLGGWLTLIADRTGRRKVLIAGSLLMIFSGTVFVFFDNYWILLISAIFGVVSVTGGDFGPFRSIEESILSHLTTPQTRADVLAWYVTFSTLGSAIGSEVSGRIVHTLQSSGWPLPDAYHMLFPLYVGMGIVNAGLTLLLTSECEQDSAENSYTEVPQQEQQETESVDQRLYLEDPLPQQSKPMRYKRILNGLFGRFSQLSSGTLKIMVKLWILLAIDSLADGMVPYSLTNYYMDEKFSPAKSTLGDVNSVAYVLGAISTVFSGPLARKIGLVNSMVFTHLPSSTAVLLFPFAPYLWLTVIFLFVRAGLNNMDQPPRSAFIAGVVKPDERTAALGITTIIRTLAAMTGPTVTGVFAGEGNFWIAFIVAGACRIIYDIGLYVLFINVKLHQHEGGGVRELAASPRISDEEMTELDDLHYKEDSDTGTSKGDTPEGSLRNSGDTGLAPQPAAGVRRRSPSPLVRSS